VKRHSDKLLWRQLARRVVFVVSGRIRLSLTSIRSSSSSSSTSGLTTASGVSVSISNVNSSDCGAITTGGYGANAYGGSVSLYLGGYAYSVAGDPISFIIYYHPVTSSCGTTNVTGLVLFISNSTFADSSAAMGTFHSALSFSFP